MREEDIDWLVFHLVDLSAAATRAGLVEATGCTDEEIAASVKRLVRAMLVQENGETIRPLSLQEMLISNQCRYDESTPFIIENGVVRPKKRS